MMEAHVVRLNMIVEHIQAHQQRLRTEQLDLSANQGARDAMIDGQEADVRRRRDLIEYLRQNNTRVTESLNNSEAEILR